MRFNLEAIAVDSDAPQPRLCKVGLIWMFQRAGASCQLGFAAAK